MNIVYKVREVKVLVFWILFMLVILWINLPTIVQKRLASRLINEDFQPLRLIEWFRIYPLKKIFLGAIWLFFAYGAIRGIYFLGIKKHEEVLKVGIFFIIISLVSFPWIFKYIRTSYHCAVVLNKDFTREDLEKMMIGERFNLVKFENPFLSKHARMFESKNWLLVNGKLYYKKYMKNFHYIFDGYRNNTILFTYYRDKKLTLPFSRTELAYDRGEEMKKVLERICGQSENL